MSCGAPATGGGRPRSGEVEAAVPRRLITALVPNGTLHDDWFPQGGGGDFTLAPIMSPLAPHRDDLVILRGLDNPVADTGLIDGHQEGVASFLTGWGLPPMTPGSPGASAGGISVDQRIAAAVGEQTRRASLVLGNENSGTLSAISYDEHHHALPKHTHPLQVFAALFGDPALDPEALAGLVARRQSVLDGVSAEYAALAKRVSGADRQKLDAHLEAIRDVERRLSIQAGCEPAAADYPVEYVADDLPTWVRDMTELVVLALACDLTRVVSLVYRRPGGGQSFFPWLGLGPEQGAVEHHEMSHAVSEHVDALRLIYTWFCEQTAYLITRLKETPDLEGSLFDSVVLLQGSECSNPELHDKRDMPFLLAGSAGGALSTGRVLDCGGAAHNDLLVSLLQLMGLPDQTFGNPYFCQGPLKGLV